MKKNGAKKVWALLLAFSMAVVSTSLPAKADNAGTPIPGIDVYAGQKTIDWNTVKNSGIQFAMIRDGYGGDIGYWNDQKDDCFEQNYSGATAAGVKVGVYHYSYATDVQGASNEADECLSILNGRHLDYPVAYDIEDPTQYGISSDTLGQMVQTFCSKVQQAGYKTVVYAFKNFYQDHLNSSLVDPYDHWLAQWDISSPTYDKAYTMWQYTSNGSVPGISGRCDMDYSYVDYANGGGSTPAQMDPLTFSSDTASYTFGSNRIYTYKITTPDTYPPTAVSSNPSAVTVSGPTATYRGFFFTLTNVGAGDATITTTAGDGRSVSFKATGTGKASSLRCDTPSYAFGSGRNVYTYKITTDASSAPTATSSNPSAVTVAYSGKDSDGYLYRITNVGPGTATITTTAADGSSASFSATGTTVSKVLRCDTSSYAFGSGRNVYTYKVTTGSSSIPTATSSNTSAVTVAYSGKDSGGYLFRITNVGAGTATITTTAADGSSASFSATGVNAPAPAIKSDTPYYFSMKPGAYYQYKFTGVSGVTCRFTTGTGSVAQAVFQQKKNGDYYFKIHAGQKGKSGVFVSIAGGTPQHVGVVTVS